MNNFSLLTKMYIELTIAAGLVLLAWQLMRLEAAGVSLMVLTALGAAAQVLKIEGPTDRSSYNLSWLVYAFSFVLLGTPAALVVIVAAHLAEWLRFRYPWYIQMFNMASYVVVASAAGWVFKTVSGGGALMSLAGVAGGLLAALVFTLANHLLVGLVVKLACGQSFAESGVFDGLPLVMDLTMYGVGIATGLLWLVSPLAIFFNLVPLYLFYSALKVPALERQVAELEASLAAFHVEYEPIAGD